MVNIFFIFKQYFIIYWNNVKILIIIKNIYNPYLGVDERVSMEGSVEYLLVLSFAPGGTLTDFLRTHMIDWITFCKMGLSMVKGLAYLHTDIHKGGK